MASKPIELVGRRIYSRKCSICEHKMEVSIVKVRSKWILHTCPSCLYYNVQGHITYEEEVLEAFSK